MAQTQLNVAELMNHGVDAAAKSAMRENIYLKSTPVLAAADLDAQVMKVAHRVKITGLKADLGKAILVAKTPAELAAQMIQARYTALGGGRGFLGRPSTQVTRCPDKVGYYRHFAGGSIYWHPHTGAHEVHGAIRGLWQSLEWERGFLGYPRTDETPGADPEKKGRYNHFQGGTIYWHPDTGAHEVHGSIRLKYFELGAEKSFLGYPTTNETPTPDRAGRFNHFQGGSIYWTRHTSAHEVHGLIRGYWAAHGWERNAALGYPISDERIPDRGIGHRPGVFLRFPHGVLVKEQASPLLRLAKPVLLKSKSRAGKASAKTRKLGSVKLKKVLRKRAVSGKKIKMTTAKPLVRAKNTRRLATVSRSVAKQSLRTKRVAVAKPKRSLKKKAIQRVELAGRPILVDFSVLRRDHTGPSRDRYSDFENGVVFWRRGASAAEILAPRAKAPNGAKMAWSATEVAALVKTRMGQALRGLRGASMGAVVYAGTTEYLWDGAGVHNRRHRFDLVLNGRRRVGFTTVPAVAGVEVQVEVSLDPVDREIGGYLTHWRLKSSMGNFYGGGDLNRTLHAQLDPWIWRQFPIANVPATAKDPIAVLSVKTQADGRVCVYFEP